METPELALWWVSEVASDSSYEEVVTPLLVEAMGPSPGSFYLDLGCGEGRIMRGVRREGAGVVGIDLSEHLSKSAGAVVGDLRSTPFRSDVADGAYAVLVAEHLADVSALFAEASRVVRKGGSLTLVSNHPVWTAPESTPIQDADGEVLWRPGEYFSDGYTDLDVGAGTVRFYHRSMAELLNTAAEAGWSLERMIEQPHHDLKDHSGIPRLIACRWRLLP